MGSIGIDWVEIFDMDRITGIADANEQRSQSDRQRRSRNPRAKFHAVLVGRRGGIDDGVDAVAHVKHIRVAAGPTHEPIVPGSPNERMIPGARIDLVMASATSEGSTTRSGENDVVEIGGRAGSRQEIGERRHCPIGKLQGFHDQGAVDSGRIEMLQHHRMSA